ncbi:hypothetical protein KC332_g6 [Hortaea werneckii]|nr:hypothetical protein KC332_g6 [Hortaea werneckii]
MGVEKVHDFPALRQNAHFLLSFESTHFVFRFWHWRHARSDGVALLFRMALISERNVAYMMKAHQIAEHRGKRQEPKSSRRSRPITRNTGKTDPPRNNLNRLRKYIGTVPDGSLNFNKHTTGICRRCLVDRLFPEGAVTGTSVTRLNRPVGVCQVSCIPPLAISKDYLFHKLCRFQIALILVLKHGTSLNLLANESVIGAVTYQEAEI